MEEPHAPDTGRVSLFLWAVAAGFAIVFVAELIVRAA
jgi:hypothetical protein